MTLIDTPPIILVTGATGYIGARLIPRLLEEGYRVRALARTPAKIDSRPWAGHPHLEIVKGDVLDRDSLVAACRGCNAAYYLVHSMNHTNGDFVLADREAASNMAAAAEACALTQIIYLGGLGEEGEALSEHLGSRTEVAAILRSGKVPVTVLRAAMIIGSGSASFEILRYIVERLPIIVTPRWVDVPCQPIGVRNALRYLTGCLQCEQAIGETFDIGQDQVVTYRQLMEIFAEEAGLPKRLIIALPILTPRLSSFWINLLTPVPAVLARPLTEGLRNKVVCQDFRIRELIPQELFDCRLAIRLALERVRQHQIESSWTDAGEVPPAEWSTPGDPNWAGGTFYNDSRQILLAASPGEVWKAVMSIGGESGWYYADWLWKLRGFLDHLVGGVGLHRGRRCPLEVSPGDALDFWRVVKVTRLQRLLLVAEMKLPGEATLEFRIEEIAPGKTMLQQVAHFLPRGLLGLMYWYAVTPFHNFIFDGMLRGFGKAISKPVIRGPERMLAP
ncbi:SDR family oxidoreductase [Geobacter sp. AOG1]|uniref:SDR family oxidoreductase n=1 Tax=Geobacter sp. AOG1 TaxID=1566346 RepID=UPI001CC3B47B|nr:SDR family oxidoreductase [Geobacter sp. AOG1]GFE57477.1 NAD(P)-dependent oxidoreductase [Geobacter sp. AOG1]